MFVNDQRCPAFASWATAVLRGRTSIDDAVDALTANVDEASVCGLPNEPEPVHLSWALGRLRSLGVTGLSSTWAAPGVTGTLPGPPDFNAQAVVVGGAVVAVDGIMVGALPDITAVGPDDDQIIHVHWQFERVQRFARPFALSLPDAERAMVGALQRGLEALARLDVAQWRDEVLDVMKSWDDDRTLGAPPGLPDRAYRVIAQTQRLISVLELAEGDDGGAISSSEAAGRQEVLRALTPSVRDASVAAWNSGLQTSSVTQ